MSGSSAEAEFSRPCPRDGYYDVFISFRGIDTRSGFTDNLYHSLLENKVYTFIDVDLAGKVIESLFKIIGSSRIAVVVYSERFASSHWCLRELETILQRWEEEKMLMIPIFYKVDAHELRHPTEKTTTYFDEHIIKYGETTVNKWRATVTKIGNVSGFPYKDIYGRSERDFIMQIIAVIKKKLGEWEETTESTSKPYYMDHLMEYDVFISFMGKDTRYGLVSHLYKALIRKEIKTIMVDQDHLKDDNIFEVIQQSKMAVIIFSENYASSKWCLRELTKILQCRNNTKKAVLPIFYEISPSDLINQATKGSRIAYHLEEHVRDELSDTVKSWRDAITDLGHIIGWRYSITHSKAELADFIQGLVEEISTILNRVEVEKKELTRNQQAHVSAKEKNAKALALQTYIAKRQSSNPCLREECLVTFGDASSSDVDFDASISMENCSDKLSEVGVESGVTEMDTLKRVKELALGSNDQQQADELEKCSSSDQNIDISPILQLRQEHIGSSTQSIPHTNTTTGEEVYCIVTSGHFQKLTEISRELLNIKPARLDFKVEWQKPSSTSFVLSNKTDNNVAFMIRQSKMQIFTVIPNKGLLMPHSTCQVTVIMKAQSVLLQAKDKLLVLRSVKANNDSASNDNISAMFKEPSENAIDKWVMHVFYDAPPQLVSVSSVPDHRAQLISKGFIRGSEGVLCIDTHSTKPWLLLTLIYGSVCIWNYETRAEEKSFNVADPPLRYSKFIPEKHWIVVGCGDGFVRIFDYNTSEKLKEFKAHENFILCLEVHPTSPYVFTTAEGLLIKLWNWENEWASGQTFEGHSNVTSIAFNPKDSSSFASGSSDGTIKIWSFDSSVAKFTIDAHAKGLNCVEYFVGNDKKLYLLSSSDDYSARVWDYDSKSLFQTLEGHSNNIMKSLVHPMLPIIITGSEDTIVRIWNKNTYRHELVWSCDLGRIWTIGFIKASAEVVLGCDDGIMMIKIVNAETQSD